MAFPLSQNISSRNQPDVSMSKPSLLEDHAAAPDSKFQHGDLDKNDPEVLVSLEIHESSRDKAGLTYCSRNATTGQRSFDASHQTKPTIHQHSQTNARGSYVDHGNQNNGRYWPIQRVWQITPQLTETIKVGSVSPMARWELESIKEESWNAVREVFIDHPVDWSQVPTDSEDDGTNVCSAVGSIDHTQLDVGEED